MPHQQLAIYLQDKHSISDEFEFARYAEQRGFDAIWQADTRLARDCISMMGALSAITTRVKIGSGVLPFWPRNVATLAATYSTLWEMSGGRIICGLGAWWEPITSKVGIRRTKPLQATREFITVLKKLFAREVVTWHSEFINLDEVELDIIHGDTRPRAIPIYIGATGDKMLELTGELADGVVLNYMVSPAYIRKAVALVRAGAERAGRDFNILDRPELIVVSMDKDRGQALDAARELLVQYLGQEPHIMKASGVSQELLDQVHAVLGWPTTKEKVQQAMHLVPDELVQLVTASGTPYECVEKVKEYIDAGCTCPIMYSLQTDARPMIDVFAEAFPRK
ncbi:MAG: LLM class flavin-dependent oxidoreductase [Chloroflexi bacterium]|nr:LLM class flavin-dependent oxidoreductase [Chloroflexota bacterium]